MGFIGSKKSAIGLEIFVSQGITRFATVDLHISILGNGKTTTSEIQVKTETLQFRAAPLEGVRSAVCPYAEVKVFCCIVPDDAQIQVFLAEKSGDFMKFQAVAGDMEIKLGVATADLGGEGGGVGGETWEPEVDSQVESQARWDTPQDLSLIHIYEPTRPY